MLALAKYEMINYTTDIVSYVKVRQGFSYQSLYQVWSWLSHHTSECVKPGSEHCDIIIQFYCACNLDWQRSLKWLVIRTLVLRNRRQNIRLTCINGHILMNIGGWSVLDDIVRETTCSWLGHVSLQDKYCQTVIPALGYDRHTDTHAILSHVAVMDGTYTAALFSGNVLHTFTTYISCPWLCLQLPWSQSEISFILIYSFFFFFF